MNRRTILQAIIPALLTLFFGIRERIRYVCYPWLSKNYGSCNRQLSLHEAKRFSNRGIISLELTPWMIGTKVFIDGVQVKASAVNCNEHYVIVIEPERLYTGLWKPGMPERQEIPTRRIESGRITIELAIDETEMWKWPQYRQMKLGVTA